MRLTADDRCEIQKTIALHSHLCDAGAYDRFDEVFTPDLEVDVSDLGLAPVPAGDPSRPRLDTYIAFAKRRWVEQHGGHARHQHPDPCERRRAGASGTAPSQPAASQRWVSNRSPGPSLRKLEGQAPEDGAG